MVMSEPDDMPTLNIMHFLLIHFRCYCAATLSSSSAFNASCSPIICAGNSTEICGGPSCASVWNNTKASVPTATLPGRTTGSSVYLGCANEVSGRALGGTSFSNLTGMTNNACEAFCQARNYQYWGTEYANEYVPRYQHLSLPLILRTKFLKMLLRQYHCLRLHDRPNRLQYAVLRLFIRYLWWVIADLALQQYAVQASADGTWCRKLYVARLLYGGQQWEGTDWSELL